MSSSQKLEKPKAGNLQTGWAGKNAGARGCGPICGDHALFYLLVTVTYTKLMNSAGQGRKADRQVEVARRFKAKKAVFKIATVHHPVANPVEVVGHPESVVT